MNLAYSIQCKRRLILIVLTLLQYVSIDATIRFNGNEYEVIQISPDRNTGLDALYVINGIDNTSIIYESDAPTAPQWSMFDNRGGAFAQPVEGLIHDGYTTTLNHIKGNCGYIIKDGNKNIYFWIIDYEYSPFNISIFNISSIQDCNYTILDFEGNASPIHYYTINGQRKDLSRDISLSFMTLDWNDETTQYEHISKTISLPSISESIKITPPVYCDTSFEISCDTFLKKWGINVTKTIDDFTPNATSVSTVMNIDNMHKNSGELSNIINQDNEDMNGISAPVRASFSAYCTDAVVHHEWQISEDEDFSNISYHIYEQDFDFEFEKEGTTYVRFVGSNDDGSCQAYGEKYVIKIGDTKLKIPNVFSPDDDGINDIWKISYTSLVEFKCWIFDRQGHELFSFENPNLGWDGRFNGKIVKPGVYYYVIQAKGADGKKYNRSGDINILRHKKFNNNPDYSE